jgi:hypothetical protein
MGSDPAEAWLTSRRKTRGGEQQMGEEDGL